MKRWENQHRIEICLDFGRGHPLRKVGKAAIAEGRTYLEFDQEFVSEGVNPSPIKLRLNTSLHEGSRDLGGLPGLLHDSLPDGWSRLVLDRAIRQAGFDHTSLNALDRLALVGTNGSGAVTYSGGNLQTFKPPEVDFDTAAALVSKAPDEEDGDRIRMALTLTGSLGGARPKANVWRKGDDFTTAETPKARLWLAKFRAKNDGPDAGAVEYAYSLMARAAGIEMPATTLLPSKQTAGYFAVERFDRTGDGERLHMHSLAGLLNASTMNSALGYRELIMVTGALTNANGNDVPSIEQQIARMAFNVLARNRDDHVKNHAFLMDAHGTWRPAPAYDLTYSNLQEHALLVGTAGREPSINDMLEVGRAVNIPDERTNAIIAKVRDVVGEWKSFATEANVAAALIRDIEESINPTRNGGGGRAAFMAWQSGRGR